MEDVKLTVLEQLVKENPNDMDLGKQIRKMMDKQNETKQKWE
jgi:uncharacterized protein with von Willebrand factor type A (vWA) domain